jgi:hypothetical protein
MNAAKFACDQSMIKDTLVENNVTFGSILSPTGGIFLKINIWDCTPTCYK